jgi:hypothetical protein
MPIELNQARKVVIEDRGHIYTLTFGKITSQMWLDYFARITHLTEYQKGKSVTTFDSSGARVALVESALVDALGYNTGSEPLISVPEWQKKLPNSHRLAAGNVLTAVVLAEEESDDAPLSLGVEHVFLRALWSANEDGSMVEVDGLVHRFTTPTAEQQRRYSRDSARSRVTSNSRSSKTEWLGAQATLMRLYDELIEEVRGYTVDGKEELPRDVIVANMDGYHKVAAAEALFAPASTKTKIDDAAKEGE